MKIFASAFSRNMHSTLRGVARDFRLPFVYCSLKRAADSSIETFFNTLPNSEDIQIKYIKVDKSSGNRACQWSKQGYFEPELRGCVSRMASVIFFVGCN